MTTHLPYHGQVEQWRLEYAHAAAGATGGATANTLSIGTSVGGFAVKAVAASQ